MSTSLLETQERVLSTLNADGSRRWVLPVLSEGRFLRRRRMVAYALIALFTLIPYIRINDKPAILLDVMHREFSFFGMTFLPTDTVLLALFMVSVFITIFLLTAIFGRVWCGWACPQTVYMEFVYRPLERLFDGPPGRFGQRPRIKHAGLRHTLKYAVYLLVSIFLAHTFLAYFVGVDALAVWVRRSPLNHPVSFLVMLVTTGLMMFDFCFFREQTCIVACPYGRFQSVLLDRHSLVVSYDRKRGEPRGKLRRKTADSQATAGDCVDCGLCVATCPTGIDIRDGIQLECVNCTQCIDACDAVMDKIGKPRGLIRYGSQAEMEGAPRRFLRPRVILYPALLAVVLTLFFVTLSSESVADITVLRGLGVPFTQIQDGKIANRLRLKITNRTPERKRFTISVASDIDAELIVHNNPLELGPRETRTDPVLVAVPRSVFDADGEADLKLRVSDGGEFDKVVSCLLLGPRNLGAQQPVSGGQKP